MRSGRVVQDNLKDLGAEKICEAISLPAVQRSAVSFALRYLLPGVMGGQRRSGTPIRVHTVRLCCVAVRSFGSIGIGAGAHDAVLRMKSCKIMYDACLSACLLLDSMCALNKLLREYAHPLYMI